MKRYMRFLLLPLITVTNAYAADPFNRPDCLYQLDTNAIKSAIGVTNTDTKEQVLEKISKKKNLFLGAVRTTVTDKCIMKNSDIQDFNNFLDYSNQIPIKLKINDDLLLDIPITRDTLAQYLTLHSYIFVLTNNTKFTPGTVVKESDLETEFKDGKCVEYFLPNNPIAGTPCSDTPLSNVAKQTLIGQYKHNYALKYKNPKGLLLQRTTICKGGLTEFAWVENVNYYDMRTKVRNFADKMITDALGCSGRNISIYIMASNDWNKKEYIVLDGPFIVP